MASRKKPKQHISARDETGVAATGISTFDDTHVAAQNAALETFVKKLKSETEGCEVSTGLAIWSAQPNEKLKSLDAGIDKWEQTLCSAAIEYYDTCFELGRRNRADLGANQPAEFAYGLTAMALSTFLRVTALDEAEENSDGRVHQFIRYVCGPPDVDVDNLPDLALDSAPTSAFHLPSWAAKYSLGDRIAGKPKSPPMGTLSAEQSEKIILAKETKLTAGLLDALSDARRTALIATAMSPAEAPPASPRPRAIFFCNRRDNSRIEIRKKVGMRTWFSTRLILLIGLTVAYNPLVNSTVEVRTQEVVAYIHLLNSTIEVRTHEVFESRQPILGASEHETLPVAERRFLQARSRYVRWRGGDSHVRKVATRCPRFLCFPSLRSV